MSDARDMPYGPIQGQGQGYIELKVSKFFHFQSLSPPPFSMGADSYRTISKCDRAGFLISVLVFVSRDFELGRAWLAEGVESQSHTGLIYF